MLGPYTASAFSRASREGAGVDKRNSTAAAPHSAMPRRFR